MYINNNNKHITIRDSTRMGTGSVPAGMTSLWSSLGTFFIPQTDHAFLLDYLTYNITILQTID